MTLLLSMLQLVTPMSEVVTPQCYGMTFDQNCRSAYTAANGQQLTQRQT